MGKIITIQRTLNCRCNFQLSDLQDLQQATNFHWEKVERVNDVQFSTPYIQSGVA